MVLALPDSKKKLVINAFLDAAIAYELQGNWRNVFTYYSKLTIGKIHKQFKLWSIESDEHFSNAINIFLEEQ